MHRRSLSILVIPPDKRVTEPHLDVFSGDHCQQGVGSLGKYK